MIESRSGLCLALETGECLRILGDGVRQEFKGDKAMQAGVLSLIDHTHAPAAQLLDDAVMGDGLADHVKPPRPAMLGAAAVGSQRERRYSGILKVSGITEFIQISGF